jgi:hypothetical protein
MNRNFLKSRQVEDTQSVQVHTFEPVMKTLVENLQKIHGPAHVTTESRGVHVYLPSPIALGKDGEIELSKRHLSVNLTSWVAGNKRVGFCHKYGDKKTGTGIYTVDELLDMPRLEDRGVSPAHRMLVSKVKDRRQYMEEDVRGNLVPRGPGKCIPLQDVIYDTTHPVSIFLHSRGIYRPDVIKNLINSMDAEYCEEAPFKPHYGYCDPEESGQKSFRKTPQGRLIVYAKMYGSRQGWQARVLSTEDGFVFHPDEKRWVEEQKDFAYAKYINGYGTQRAEILFGFDRALAFNRNTALGVRTVGIAEGPLDIAVTELPVMAIIGKTVSERQLQLLVSNFDRFMIFPDSDKYGDKLVKNLQPILQSYGKICEVAEMPDPVDGKKLDLGRLNHDFVYTQWLRFLN